MADKSDLVTRILTQIHSDNILNLLQSEDNILINMIVDKLHHSD